MLFVRRKIRRLGHLKFLIHAEFVFVGVHDAVNVVNVVVEEILSGGYGDDGLQRGWAARSHLQRIETAPRDAGHSDVSVRPRLAREPRDHFRAVALFNARVFTIGRSAFTRPSAADIDASADVSAQYIVGMKLVIPRLLPIIFAVRNVFENRGKFLGGLCALRKIESHRELYTVGHRNPGFLDADTGVERLRVTRLNFTGWRFGARRHEPEHGDNGQKPFRETGMRDLGFHH